MPLHPFGRDLVTSVLFDRSEESPQGDLILVHFLRHHDYIGRSTNQKSYTDGSGFSSVEARKFTDDDHGYTAIETKSIFFSPGQIEMAHVAPTIIDISQFEPETQTVTIHSGAFDLDRETVMDQKGSDIIDTYEDFLTAAQQEQCVFALSMSAKTDSSAGKYPDDVFSKEPPSIHFLFYNGQKIEKFQQWHIRSHSGHLAGALWFPIGEEKVVFVSYTLGSRSERYGKYQVITSQQFLDLSKRLGISNK